MADLNKQDLDNYLTGHYGEDQLRETPEEDQTQEEATYPSEGLGGGK